MDIIDKKALSERDICTKYITPAIVGSGWNVYTQIREEVAAGTGQPNVNGVALSNLIAPLPPLAEQHRIVARVDQLMSLCDELEAGLMRSQADSEKLIRAVVGRMLAGGDGQEQAAEEIKTNIAIINDKI